MKKSYDEFQRKCGFRTITAFCALLAAIFFSPSYASAQSYSLSGTVKTEKGEPVPGATIILSGTQLGATSDTQGNFTLRISNKPATDASLIISYLGYTTQTIPIGAQTTFNIVLAEESTAMDEVVVVGYGAVKKKDLTGALSSVGGEAILNRQTQHVANALQGAMPGVTVTRTSSAPDAAATIRIRGITTITSVAQDPYILIDGTPGSMNDVNPNDIESLTVLKDAASASIYGSQAAAGVILITTKRAGKTGASVTYNYSLGLDYPTNMPDYMNAVDYMKAVNELRYNDLPSGGWYQEYAKERIDNYWLLNRENPDLFPNTDWAGLLLKKVALRHSHNLTISAGGDKRSTSLSMNFDDVDGLFRKNLSWKRYTVRLNNDIQVFKWMKASADISLRYVDKVNPHASPSGTMRYIPAIYNAVWSDGRYAPGKDGINKYAALLSGGTKDSESYQASAKFQVDISPVKGLTVTALFSPRFTYDKSKDFQRQVSYFNYGEESANSTKYISDALTTELEESRGDTFSHTTQIYANYAKTFGEDHNFSAMAGYENYWYEEGIILAGNSSFPHGLMPDLNSGNSDGATAKSKDVNELARRSYFGRLMYNYKSKYYVQGNIRTDGSSRFAKNHRWGTFLSASAGWVFTEEKFMQGARKVLDHGKLRVSYGELGNERISGYYPYQMALASNHTVGYVGGNLTALTGYAQASAVVQNLTWETTSTIDVGIDLYMLGSRLSLTADWYYKKTTDMLLTAPLPPVIGLGDPNDNVGDMHTKGWEISLGWRDRVGDFRYGVTFNLSDDVSKMGYIGNKEIISGGKIIREGDEYQSWYGYVSDGLYQTQAEVDNSVRMGPAAPGDIRYKNFVDNEGVDPIINPDDRKVLGSSLPHFNYGGTIDLGWKGIDFSLTFQGVGKRNSYMTDEMAQPLRSQWYNVPKIIEGKSWSRTNTIAQNERAKYPRYSWSSVSNNYAISDFWLFDGSYFRIKNITLGYTLPDRWMSKIRIKSLRFSATLTDFFTISNFPKGWDPEAGVTAYPITKSVLFSAQLKF
ncbi:TonB-dependent receptor [uncultured Alistipes sp.]|jgi:tonB-linked outer membrane protein, susC/ragA family|uniref:SusC/RagA family TonB-linked outer membrane protein n=1 Tax=uncultured Alistipes sp. TaxID=538949 RepID=UPI0025D7EA28|nr:TonB-dependent receptor [uncultured Alistipes sp.]